jgi:hypothetical protein
MKPKRRREEDKNQEELEIGKTPGKAEGDVADIEDSLRQVPEPER